MDAGLLFHAWTGPGREGARVSVGLTICAALRSGVPGIGNDLVLALFLNDTQVCACGGGCLP